MHIAHSRVIMRIHISILTWHVFQVHARPYRVAAVNDLQLVASVCLVLLSILNSAKSAFQSAGFNVEETEALKVQTDHLPRLDPQN
jgi:hypothetical protein